MGMNKILVIIYYGAEPKPPKLFYPSDMEVFLHEVRDLTKKRTLFAVYELGNCVGDFS